jgi:hypothetical protein
LTLSFKLPLPSRSKYWFFVKLSIFELTSPRSGQGEV